MFDFHMHSRVSFDGKDTAADMAAAAARAGLKEICFTDHLDYDPLGTMGNMAFRTEDYNAAYDGLRVPGVVIRRGMEFGMTADNREQFQIDLQRRPFDFVIGSVHFVDDLDVYFAPFWEGKTVLEAEQRYLQTTLECVKVHDDFDVLGHLTYLCKARAHPTPRPISYETHREVVDEILKILVSKGKGLELNTSGMDRCGEFLPGLKYFRRFKELGGEIVTVGSDAHDVSRVGQHCRQACRQLEEIFGWVCTFSERRPVFHRLGK